MQTYIIRTNRRLFVHDLKLNPRGKILNIRLSTSERGATKFKTTDEEARAGIATREMQKARNALDDFGIGWSYIDFLPIGRK